MTERGMPREERQNEEVERIERESANVGPGLGAGLAPVLPTDLDGQNPETDWQTTSRQDTSVPNWAAHEEIEPGRERLDSPRTLLNLPDDTHLVSVFGEDLGKIEEIYGYAPSNDPQWASIRDGDRHILVPVMSGQLEDDGLHVPYPKNLIDSAPELPPEFSLSDEMRLYSHYNERRILPATDGASQEHERTLHVLNSVA